MRRLLLHQRALQGGCYDRPHHYSFDCQVVATILDAAAVRCTSPGDHQMNEFTWKKAREELAFRRARALEHGGEAKIAKQRSAGRGLARERLAAIVDPGSFSEIGTLATDREFDTKGNALEPTAAPFITGLAKIDARPVVVGADDFTVSGGHSMLLERHKGMFHHGFAEELAHEYRIPLLECVENVGGGVGQTQSRGYSMSPTSHSFGRCLELLGEVPVLMAGMGACAGGAGSRLVMSHFSVMTRHTACAFGGGPPMVERSLGRKVDKFALGGADIHTKISGIVDNVAEDEDDAIAQMKRVLGYLPQNVWEVPPFAASDDPIDRRDEKLLKIVPENRRRAYDSHKLVDVLVDKDSFFEIGRDWGRSLVVGLCRFGGFPVGILASNPMHLGGALDSQASEKHTRFVEFMDTFHIPIVYLVDVPGFMVGEEAEQAAILRRGTRAIQAMAETTTPVITVQIRKSMGMAAMATSNPYGMNLRVVWPSAEFGDMPIEGAVMAVFRRAIEAAPDPDAYRRQLEAELLEQSLPWKTAEVFGIEELIDPTETRELICRFIEAAQGRIRSILGPRARYGVRV